MGRRSSRRRWRLLRPALWYLGLSGGFLLAAGTAHWWGMLAYLVLIGGGLILRPPSALPHSSVNYGLAIILIWTLAQMLPGSSQGGAWRHYWEEFGFLPLGTAAALEPGAQILAFVYLLAASGALFLAFGVHQHVDRDGRRFLLDVFGFGVAVIGMVCAFMNYRGEMNPIALGSHVFTFLPNRNLCALLCAVGGVVCFAGAFDGILRHPWRGVLFLFGTFGCLVGVLSLLSRASFALFVLGCLAWVVISTHRSGVRKRFKVIIPIFALLLASVFIFGEQTILRLVRMVLDDGIAGTSPSTRLAIWTDTIKLIPTTWLSGTGWGTFHSVIGIVREASRSTNSLAHPENDYLWVWIEGGVPILLGLAFLLYGIWRAAGRHETGNGRNVRLVSVLLLLYLLQGLVDTPLHSATLMLFAFWLIGIWVAPSLETGSGRPLWLGPKAWRGVGFGLIISATVLGAGYSMKRPWIRSVVAEESFAMLRDGPQGYHGSELPRPWLKRARFFHPLEWTVHSAEARWALAEQDFIGAQRSFQNARIVCGDMGEVTWAEAMCWGQVGASSLVLDAWRETFLERGLYDAPAKFEALILRFSEYPLYIESLSRISRENSTLRLLFLRIANPLRVRELKFEFERNPKLQPWNHAEKSWLIWSFGRNCGWNSLFDHFSENPELAAEFPLFVELARAEVDGWSDSGQRLSEIVTSPPPNLYGDRYSLAELGALVRRSPTDMAILSAFIREAAKQQEWAQILGALDEFRSRGRSNEPKVLSYWRAYCLTRLDRGREAGEAWIEYLKRITADKH